MRSKSKELKEMQGTFEPSKEDASPIELENWDGSRMPAAPEGWPPHIQKLWNERCRDLFNYGYLTKAFIAPLRRYCFAVYQAEEAESTLMSDGFIENKINVDGVPYEAVSKWIMVLDNANKTMERIGAKFGFTPLDIQKIPAIKKDKPTMSLLK